MKRLTFYFDYSSPFAYLASTQVVDLAKRNDAELILKPFLLGGLFRSLGTANVPLFAMNASKRRYYASDLFHWADYWGVPFNFPTRFPMNTVKALRLTLAAEASQKLSLMRSLFDAYWVDDVDLNDVEALGRVPGVSKELLDKTELPQIKTALRETTEEAETAGVCGAPSFVVEAGGPPLLFWGQDRLDFVEAALCNDDRGRRIATVSPRS